jgi:nucleotide-binding universal stress UspA family protein
MCVESLTYGALGARLNISPAAARALARRLQLPRSRSADGKALVSVDLTQIRHTPHPPVRRQAGDVAELTAQIAALRADNAQLEAMSAEHRADFLMAEVLQANVEVTAAREMAARLEGEVAVLRTRARTDSSIDKTERRLGQLAATLVDSDRKAARG